MVDKKQFKKRLNEEFNCTEKEREQVARQAIQLANSGIYQDPQKDLILGGQTGHFINDVMKCMQSAPNHLRITGKWNWWISMSGYSDSVLEQFKC